MRRKYILIACVTYVTLFVFFKIIVRLLIRYIYKDVVDGLKTNHLVDPTRLQYTLILLRLESKIVIGIIGIIAIVFWLFNFKWKKELAVGYFFMLLLWTGVVLFRSLFL
jgi:hypothetical protein